MEISIVPAVIDKIITTIEELINLGAQKILVPGNSPIGCIPMFLTEFRTSNISYYDTETGCINWLNELAKYHNKLLLRKLNSIQKLHPHVNIIYADYYNAAIPFYISPNEFGFTGGVLKACCGVGGLYNYNELSQCGNHAATCCDNPSSFVCWDGIHLTEAAYKLMAQASLEAHLSTICPSISSHSEIYKY